MKLVTASGTSWPDASTGISSYFSKLIPMFCLVGSFGTPKSSRSRVGSGGPGICFPSAQRPSPEPECLPELGAPYPLESKARRARGGGTSHPVPPAAFVAAALGVKVGAEAQPLTWGGRAGAVLLGEISKALTENLAKLNDVLTSQ